MGNCMELEKESYKLVVIKNTFKLASRSSQMSVGGGDYITFFWVPRYLHVAIFFNIFKCGFELVNVVAEKSFL